MPLFDESKRSKLSLLAQAQHLGLLSDVELRDSIPNGHKTIKLYLRTMIQEGEVLEKLDNYVEAYSLLWTRSLLALNLFTHEVSGIPLSASKSVDKERINAHIGQEHLIFEKQANLLFSHIFGSGRSPLLLKQLFLPEKWMEKGSLLPILEGNWLKYSSTLSHLFPSNWEQIMMKSGWDEVIISASKTTRANIEVHVRKAIVIGAKEYAKQLATNDEEVPKLLKLLTKPWSKNQDPNLSVDVIKAIYNLRELISLNDDQYMPQFALDVTPKMLSVFFYMRSTGILRCSLMPRGSLSHKFSYLDDRCLKYMFLSKYKEVKSRQQGEVSMLEVLGFSLASFKASHKAKKKRILKEARVKKRKKKFEKWKHRGRPKIPNNARIASIKTDGIGLCLTLTYPLKLPKWPPKDIPNKNDQDEQRLESVRKHERQTDTRPIFVGIDAGRAKLYCAAILNNQYADPKHVAFTRQMYYANIKFKRRKQQWQNRVSRNNSLKTAIEDLSQNPGLMEYLQAQQRHMDVLYQELVHDKRQALQAMLAWRLKCSSQAKAANYLVQKMSSPHRNTLIGIGHCTVAPTGRGELSVPTKSIYRTLQSTITRHNRNNRNNNRNSGFISSISINEHRTTLLCCDCASVTYSPYVTKNGERRRSSRLRYCKNCDLARDRDHQASSNILRLTIAKYKGEDRPSYFCYQRRS